MGTQKVIQYDLIDTFGLPMVVFNIDIQHLQGSTLTVVRLPGASEMRLRANENGTQLVRSGK